MPTANTRTPSSTPAAAVAVRTWPYPTGTTTSGNQKSHCAISPATYVVRDAGSGGRYTGRNSRTRSLSVRIEYGQPIRSAITVAGIRRIRRQQLPNPRLGLIGHRPRRRTPILRRAIAEANAAFTVFRETPNTRAISEIGNRSDRRNRRISAQSSTLNTRFLPGP